MTKIATNIILGLILLNLVSCTNKISKTDTKIHFDNELGFSIPDSLKIINDFGEVFTRKEESELENLISTVVSNSSKKIIIVTTSDIKPYTDIHKYATDLGNDWGIASPKDFNGLTIVLCKPCRKIGIATAVGTENKIKNEFCKNVINQIMIPEFKNGNYHKGMKEGLLSLILKWEEK
ncbi:hypothetical protein BTO06_15935 [Tenacibaculum sp. SZ-18]|uniref:TPM domain-containing protein n=1 Tax=Tenacibaculum sp. SZ-18 TaxID=754423 RepID=UPI000C2D5650|nr:TPM domain-containing protein [Tenacibaculum sp. SZ-18]AUC15786.1 hypothetical protein BTO06_11780 [Tenacibaculum sp. SZ-18]AUC16547.1 hypothetical protein BTO06_15935 [Tenacibaculum sp. SZ-18]